MTNFERLKNLTLSEILEEIDFPIDRCDSDKLAEVFSEFMLCDTNGAACNLCDVVPGSCRFVLKAWLDKESPDDANYGVDLCWRDFCYEMPPELGHPNEYIVVVNKYELATVLTWNGSEWYDEDHNTYNVKWWMPIPTAPNYKK